ncbi:MAG: amino acid adenylation domain-containing protein [SAR324 cluster bacterium]|nr:amino acid adenylation domain-containing protein [SAR324 cluster bacterium]
MFDKKNVKNIYALTPMQEGMLFFALYDNTSLAYFEQVFYHISGKLYVEFFEKTWNELIHRHDILRTIFVYKNVPQPLQIVLKQRKISVHFVDLQALSPEEQEAHCRQYKEKDQHTPFDLSKDPLMRFALFQLGETSYNLVWSCHHILLDGWSVSLLYKEFFSIYEALHQGQSVFLPPPVPFSKYLTWLNKQDKNEAKRYWQTYLQGYHQRAAFPQFPSNFDAGETPLPVPENFTFQMTEALTSGLNELAFRNHVTLNTVFVTLWGILLGVYNNLNDVVFGAAVSGRPAGIEGIEDIVGLFINTIPVRVRKESGQTFKELLQIVQKEAAQGKEYHYTSLVDIMMETPLKQSLFDHILIFENFPSLENAQEGANNPFVVDRFEQFELTSYDLSIQVFPGKNLEFVIIYQPAVYNREVIECLKPHLTLMLESVLENESLELQDLSVLSDDEEKFYHEVRKALPVEDEIHRKIFTAYSPPENEQQNTLLSIWKELLNLEDVGIDDNYFELGGHSLLATRIVSKIHKSLKIEISLREFFNNPNIRALDKIINQKNLKEYAEITALPQHPHYPVSHAQRRLWILEQMQGEAAAYNMSGAVSMAGDLNLAAFQKAFQTLVNRHDSLRTTFVSIDSEPRQKVCADIDLTIEMLDLSAEEGSEEKAREFIRKDANRLFDLEKGPLLQASLLKLADRKYIFVFNIHHIIGDGWSFGILVKEIFCLYDAFLKGQQNPLPSLRIQYKDYTAWQNELLESKNIAPHREYWLQKLSGELPILELPTDFPRPAKMTYHGRKLSFTLAPGLADAFNQVCRSNQASLFMGLLSIVKILLYRYSSQEDIIVGSPIAGRNHPDLEDQIGFYVNTLALRDQINSNDTFLGLLQKIKQTTIEAFDHQDYPFDKLVDELNVPRFTDRSPLFDVMVVLQNQDFEEIGLSGVHIIPFAEESSSSRFDLTLNFAETDSTIQAEIEYRTDLFTAAGIHRLWGHFESLVDAALKSPEEKIGSLGLLTPSEIIQITNKFNQTKTDFPQEQTLGQLFERQEQQSSNAPALVFDGGVLSYQELNAQANVLAHYLKDEIKIKPEEIVAVIPERSQWSIVALLGILKAGGVYLPIDPSYPEARVQFILKDSRCKIVLVEPGTRDHVVGLEQIKVFDLTTLPMAGPISNPAPRISSNNLAYLIYTSGSTGTPKGVMIEHRGFINMTLAQIREFEVNPTDRVLLFSSISFDASLSEIFMALLSGASLVLVSKEVLHDLEEFTDYLQRKQVTVITLPPSYLSNLGKDCLPTVRTLITAGEAAHVDEALNYSQSKRYFNAFGPTEYSVCISIHQVSPDQSYPSGIPIGKPIANTEVFILDQQLNLVPIGVIGEICVSGAGMARGYLGQETLTLEKFIAHPFRPGERLYRSGDLGKWQEDGNIIFLGRKDDQVKIRGYRIELGEITQRLLEHANVKDGIVLDRINPEGTKELLAYVVAVDGHLETVELRNFLSAYLPSYMIPSYFLPLEILPLNSNGKIDKQALPAPENLVAANRLNTDSRLPYEPPRSLIETRLVDVWQEILRHPSIGIGDNFFTLGGDSIKAIQMVANLRQKQFKTSVHQIFQHQTIAELAPNLVSLEHSTIDQATVAGSVELTPIQHHFFTEHQIDPHHFNQALLLKSKRRFDQETLLEVLQAIQIHHDVLRIRYRFEEKQVFQEIEKREAFLNFRVIDLREKEEPVALQLSETEKVQESMDLEQGSLMKTVLFRLPGEDQLLIVIHHLLVDGISWRILVEDLHKGYEQKLNGKQIQFPEKSHSYQHWAQALKHYAESEVLLAEKTFWQSVIACREGVLACDHESSERRVRDISIQSFHLSAAATKILLGQAQQVCHAGINDLLLTTLARAFYQWQGNRKTLIYLESHGRGSILEDIDVSRTIGWFTSFYPFILELPKQEKLMEQIQYVKECLRRIPHKGIGFGILRYLTELPAQEIEKLHGKARVSFNYLGQFDQEMSSGLFEVSPESTGSWASLDSEPLHDLYIEGIVLNKHLEMNIHYHPGQYKKENVAMLWQSYQEELEQLITIAEDRIS